ncbi:MAG: HAMP domain-containing sensor histidine kinase [Polyangiales bacterium]
MAASRVRLALKLTLVLTLWTLIVLSGYGYYRMQHALAWVEADLRRDELLVGSVLRPAVEQAYAAGGRAEAERVVRSANDSERFVQIRIVEHVTTGDDEADYTYLPNREAPESLVSYVPLTLHRSPAGEPVDLGLELVVSLDEERLLARNTLLDLAVVLLLIGVCSFGLASWVGWRLVGRPVGALVQLLRQVGRGEEAHRVDLRGNDELVDLAAEMNRMVELMAVSRRREADEANRAGQLQEQLRHADRLATMGMLMARVAHDVGTPLNVIGSRLDRVLSGRVEGDAALRDVRIANEQTERITAAIGSLLDFAHRGDAERSEIAPEQLLRRARELLATVARAHRVELQTVSVVPPDIRLRTAPQLTLQALTNLCVNALHASGAGTEVTVRARAAGMASPPPGVIAHAGPYVCFSVEDHGPGLPTGKEDEVFEPFFTTKPVGEGTGLGLPIARSIAHDLGGWLEVHARIPRGTRFDLYLPIHPS